MNVLKFTKIKFIQTAIIARVEWKKVQENISTKNGFVEMSV
jgi:hypothetical protein